MDHMRILRRAFDITRLYRALWVFGVLLALTTASGGPGSGGGGGRGDNGGGFPPPGNMPFPRDFPPFRNFPPDWSSIPPEVINTVIAVVIAAVCIGLALAVLFTIVRYVSFTALVRMVNRYEDTGERVSVGEGFRLGWSRAAFRSFLAALLVGVTTLVAVILLIALAAAPLLLWTTGSDVAGAIGTVMTIGLGFLFILALIVVLAGVNILLELAYRAIILEDLGVFDGLRRAWELFRGRLGDVIIMGLILFGLGLVFAVVMIPVLLILLLAGLIVAGLPALLVLAVVRLIFPSGAPYLLALVVALPIFLAVVFIPSLFISGLYHTYTNSVWTLTYRELLALEAVPAE